MSDGFTSLSLNQLENTLASGAPDNEGPEDGYALVNVLAPEQFERQHIPRSINIPQDDLDEFEQRFDEDKKIVVYCASPECTASRDTAEALAERGFRHVFDFEGGLSEWKEAGNPVEGEGAEERASG